MPPCPCPAAETYEPCHNPGVPAGGRQSPERRLYPAGTTLHFSCTAGRVLLGEGSLRCLPGHPSRWSGSPPICKAGERTLPLPGTPAAPLGTQILTTRATFFLPPLPASYDEFYSNRNLDGKGKGVPGQPGVLGCGWAPRGAADVKCHLGEPSTFPGSCGQGRALGDSAGGHQCCYRRLPACAGGGPAHWGHLPLLLQVSVWVAPCHPMVSPQPPCCSCKLPSPHRFQGKPALQLPLTGSHPYDHITVESAFDNPTYETGVSTGPHTHPAEAGHPGDAVSHGPCVPGTVSGVGQRWDGGHAFQEPYVRWDIYPGTTYEMEYPHQLRDYPFQRLCIR